MDINAKIPDFLIIHKPFRFTAVIMVGVGQVGKGGPEGIDAGGT
jgi:hypothetical protein